VSDASGRRPRKSNAGRQIRVAASRLKESFVPRVISFIVLLAIILLVGAVFFQVMAQFLVPMFLACVLLVVFQPLHRWILDRLPTHPRISALITTVLILLVVILPLTGLGWKAYVELHRMFAPQPGAVAATPGSTAVGNTSETTKSAAAKKEEVAFQENVKQLAYKLRDKFNNFSHIFIDNKDVDGMLESGKKFVTAKAISGLQSAVGILIGLAIMVISLYYFLADGPTMIDAVMELSPLDYRYEQELLERFGNVSRAVVVATLLSAMVQGILAGFGYAFALTSEAPIFLLIVITMTTAMVPFVGAAFTWICVCGWIYLYGEHVVDNKLVQGDPRTAILLAIYCAIVVSQIDNVIKPFVLHGQSKLHPLLALLSILGGVQVLGPVGILVGPMVVSFLQALLNMLRKELDSFGGPVVDSTKPLAESVAEVMQMTGNENASGAAAPAGDAVSGNSPGQGSANPLPPADKTSRFRRPKRKR
jgi:predicted PurR-regulated permease PerM